MIEHNFNGEPVAIYDITSYLQREFKRETKLEILIRSELYDIMFIPPELVCFDNGCNFTVNAHGIRGYKSQCDLRIYTMPQDEQQWKTDVEGLVNPIHRAVQDLNKRIEDEFYKRKDEPHKYNAKDKLMDKHIQLCDQAIKLMNNKNNDYSYGDDPYNNFRGSDMLGVSPIIGILLRMQDKMMRIKTFALCNNLNVKEESVNDSIIDLINYAVLIAGFIEYEKNKETK